MALRLVTLEDASYIYALRTDPNYNTHLSPVIGTIEDQCKWIQSYKQREAEGREAYYVIERRRDGQHCGLVRLYNITTDRFTWGSWILDVNKPPKAALECAILVYDVAFGQLGLVIADISVRKANYRSLAVYRRFGAIECGADAQSIFFSYDRDRFLMDRPRHMRALRETNSS